MNRMQLAHANPHAVHILEASRGILFDMDGVLIDSEPAHEQTILELSQRLGRRFEEPEARALRGMTDEATARHMREIFPQHGHSLQELIAMREQMYHGLFHQVRPIEGAKKFVEQSKALGFAIALATSSLREAQNRAFETFGFTEYFDVIITGSDVTQGKPHPEPYLKAAAELDLKPEECVVIEDSVNGVRSGKAAGCRVIGLTTSFPPETLIAWGADLTVASFQDLALTHS